MNFPRIFRAFVALGIATFAFAAPAVAGVSAGGGLFASGGNGSSSSGAAVLISSGRAVPVLPAELDITGFAPLARGGGYAQTLEGRFGMAGNAIGAGYGIGQFGGSGSGGTFTAFLDHGIAPFTSLELRGYQTTGSNSATAGFLGVRFSF